MQIFDLSLIGHDVGLRCVIGDCPLQVCSGLPFCPAVRVMRAVPVHPVTLSRAVCSAELAVGRGGRKALHRERARVGHERTG
jgi:hypothetical protein